MLERNTQGGRIYLEACIWIPSRVLPLFTKYYNSLGRLWKKRQFYSLRFLVVTRSKTSVVRQCVLKCVRQRQLETFRRHNSPQWHFSRDFFVIIAQKYFRFQVTVVPHALQVTEEDSTCVWNVIQKEIVLIRRLRMLIPPSIDESFDLPHQSTTRDG